MGLPVGEGEKETRAASSGAICGILNTAQYERGSRLPCNRRGPVTIRLRETLQSRPKFTGLMYGFFWSVSFISFVSFNQINQTDRTDQ